MGQVALDGTITVGPSTSGATVFPGLTDTVPFTTTPSPKMAQAWPGMVRSVNSPSAYIQLSGVGTNDTLTKANLFYLRSSTAFKVRITYDDTPTPLVSEQWVQGLCIIEAPDNHSIIKLEVMGSGQIEYLASGNQ
jgi:hypothetical protein